MVNVALKRVREEMRQYGAPVDKALVDSDIPMARIADVLGSILTTGPGDRAGPPNSPSPKTKSAKRRKIQISKPKAGKLRHEGGELVGEFTATVSAAEEHKVRIIAHPSVVFEGNSVGDTAPNGRSPQIIRWKKGGRVIEEHSSSIELDVSDEHELTIDVTFPDFVAVKLSVRLEEINGTD